jgi:ABC-type cobalamin transport system ATPase subunit
VHRAQLSLDERLHLLGGDVRLGKCALLKTVAAILSGSGSIRIGAAAQWIPAQRHTAALAGGSFRFEHFSSDTD